jgi:hypothetical protein
MRTIPTQEVAQRVLTKRAEVRKMGRRKDMNMERDFEHPFAEGDPPRGRGVMATLAVLTIIGVVVWLLFTNGESS